MRFYAVGNQYLSSIQQGIQAAHCLGELVKKYGSDNKDISSWLHSHKTIICLNGGNNARLGEFFDFLLAGRHKNTYPYAFFTEDEQSLGGLLTCVGVLVPESLYSLDPLDPEINDKLPLWDQELLTKLKRMPTAR
jgi:hypothetical protein